MRTNKAKIVTLIQVQTNKKLKTKSINTMNK